VLGTWLLSLTVTSAVLLVPALVAVLTASRRSHRAVARGLQRRLRLVAAATVVGAAAVVVRAVLGGGALSAVLEAGVLAASVLGVAPPRRTWAVRAVVVRALLGTVTVSGLFGLAHRAASSGPPLPTLGVLVSLLLAATFAAAYLWQRADAWLEARPGGPVRPAPNAVPVAVASGDGARRHRRTAVALGALLVPVGAVTALTDGGVVPDRPPPGSQGGTVPSPQPATTGAPATARSDRAGPSRTVTTSPDAGSSGTPTTAPAVTGVGATAAATSSTRPRGGESETPRGSASPSPSAGQPSPTESSHSSGFPTAIPVPTFPEGG
jgi:hypothetical protein